MAYMDQEKKARIAAELKKVMPPTGWKYSLKVKHYSSITLTISEAPIDLFHLHKQSSQWKDGYIQLNEYHLGNAYDGKLLKTFESIRTALNVGNYDHSDVQTDYFDVGHYAYIHIGRWDKPFQVTATEPKRTYPPGSPEYERLKARLAELEAK